MVGERTSAEPSRAARIDGLDGWGEHWIEDFHISQNEGAELIAQGTNEWIDYWATVLVNILLAKEKGWRYGWLTAAVLRAAARL